MGESDRLDEIARLPGNDCVQTILRHTLEEPYRSNDSRPMPFIAAGLVLAFGGPGGVFALSVVVPIPTTVVEVVTQATELVGFLLVLYGFVAPARI